MITDGQDLMHVDLFWRNGIPGDWKGLGGDRSRRLACEYPVRFGDPNAVTSLSEQSVAVRGYGTLHVNNALDYEFPSGLPPILLNALAALRGGIRPPRRAGRSGSIGGRESAAASPSGPTRRSRSRTGSPRSASARTSPTASGSGMAPGARGAELEERALAVLRPGERSAVHAADARLPRAGRGARLPAADARRAPQQLSELELCGDRDRPRQDDLDRHVLRPDHLSTRAGIAAAGANVGELQPEAPR